MYSYIACAISEHTRTIYISCRTMIAKRFGNFLNFVEINSRTVDPLRFQLIFINGVDWKWYFIDLSIIYYFQSTLIFVLCTVTVHGTSSTERINEWSRTVSVSTFATDHIKLEPIWQCAEHHFCLINSALLPPRRRGWRRGPRIKIWMLAML